MVMQLQDHIHLALTLSGDAEQSPIYKWKTTDRKETKMRIMTVQYPIGGSVRVHVQRDSANGQPARFSKFSFIFVVEKDSEFTLPERADLLDALYGKECYFVDSFHVPDGEDHSAYVRTAMITELGDFPMFTQMFPKFFVPVEITILP